MLSKKLSNLLYELSKNSRQSTKKIGKLLRISQQSASYLILSALKNKTILNYHTLIDPARFGLTNILVMYNYTNFDSKKINEIQKAMKDNDYITIIEEASLGADMLVQFTVPNLSLFNKENQELLYKFRKDLKLVSIYPIIVKHLYTRKYLRPQKEDVSWILSGDRDVMQFNEKQKALMKELNRDGKISLLQLAKNMKTDTKTVARIKKNLENRNVIRQYSIVINHKKLGIKREKILIQLNSDEKKETDRFISFCKFHKNILTAIKLIGDYEIILTVEKFGEKDVLSELRKEFHIAKYKLIKVENILKSETVPRAVLE